MKNSVTHVLLCVCMCMPACVSANACLGTCVCVCVCVHACVCLGERVRFASIIMLAMKVIDLRLIFQS